MHAHSTFKSLIKRSKLPLLLAFSLSVAALANAQDISQYYTTQHPKNFDEDFTHDLYIKGNRLTAETRKQYPHHLDLAYGTDIKQHLDVYLPKKHSPKAPVLLFIHGGGFVEGDRAHYGFIARPFASHGIITVVASYRLTGSGVHYPGQADDIKQAILWIHEHIKEYGGNPDSIFVSGHSAGAVLSAEVGANRDWLTAAGASPDIIKGIAAVSGPYDLRNLPILANYTPTLELSEAASPILHIHNPVPTAVIAFGTNNKQEDGYSPSARKFADALLSQGTQVKVVEITGAWHIGTVMALGTPGSPLAKAVLEMIKESK